MKFKCILVLLLFWASNGLAQNFSITGASSSPLKGKYVLTLFEPDGTSQQFKCASKHGDFHFSGSVKSPLVASLSHSKSGQQLYFYLENANITISFNEQQPQSSPISGSRSNSNYRIILEDCSYSGQEDCLKVYVRNNPTSIYSPYILAQNIYSWDYEEVVAMMNQFQGEAVHTYHYQLLKKQIANIGFTQIGQQLKDFVYCNQKGEEVHFADVQHPNQPLLLVITASWCNDHYPQTDKWKMLQINIDDDKSCWESPFLEQLTIDHIPYIMLLDSCNTILAKDLRVWQLDKLLKK